MSSSISVQPTRAAQGAQSTARNLRRTNQEMVLQPLWEGYLRAIQQKLQRGSDFAARFGCPDREAIQDAAEMLTAFALAVEERRYVTARRTKAERALYERICLLLSQVEHSLHSVKLAQTKVMRRQAAPGADSAAALIGRAIAELPKLDQIAAVAMYLGFAPCLSQMVFTGFR